MHFRDARGGDRIPSPPTGGIRPAPRRRSRLALTLPEREEISRGLAAGRSMRALAQALGRAPSTISREIAPMADLAATVRRAPTPDRGKELTDHKRFTMETSVDVYFCDPQSSGQRGSNEHTNRLLRQYLPHGLDLAPYSQAELNKIARELNERPRKTLDYESPAERFNECVAATR